MPLGIPQSGNEPLTRRLRVQRFLKLFLLVMGSRILGGAIGGVIEAGFTGFEETLLRQMTPPIWVACTLAAAVVYCITEKPAGVTDQDAALMPFILPKLFLLCLVALFVLAYAIYS